MEKRIYHTMAESQEILRLYLLEHGPSTSAEIMRIMRWPQTKLSHVLQSRPDWLVAVGVKQVTRTSRKVLFHCEGEHELGVCEKCGRRNFHPSFIGKQPCQTCRKPGRPKKPDTYDISGIDPHDPCDEQPGSLLKCRTLAARYAHGLPLWDKRDATYETADSAWVGPPEEHIDDDEDWD